MKIGVFDSECLVKRLVMENSLVKSGGREKSKKSRSLDVKSVYKNGGSKNEKRKGGTDEDGELGKNIQKKRSRKETLLSSFVEAGKQSESSIDKFHGDKASLDISPQSKGKLGILLSLDGSGSAIKIPKRPRGFVGRKKSENNHDSSRLSVDKVDEVVGKQVPESEGPSGGEADSAGKIARSNDGVKGVIVSLKGKGKVRIDGNKKSSSKKASAPVSKTEEEVHLVVNNNGDAFSSEKRSSNHKKRKGSEILSAKAEPSAENVLATSVDSLDEDEEKLEQNAARMLSSRFNSSSTQFSSKIRSPSLNDLSSLRVSEEDFVSRRINMSSGSELASGDLADRVLRPRKRHKDDDVSRKRRHFYEICYGDLDPLWVLNRRIKVFWPLDESWYYGLVSDYRPETKRHHIKYDDRDEEWIDLQNEKFKLLLLPSEVPHKPEPRGDALENRNDDVDDKNLPSDDSLESSYMDSEPIISWLVRSSQRVKSSHIGSSKRLKSSLLSEKLSQKLSIKSVSAKEGLEKSDSSNKLNCNLELQDRSSSISRDGNSPVVYVRRRFRKKDHGLIDTDKACGKTPVSTVDFVPKGFYPTRENDYSHGLAESERLLPSVGHVGLLKLTSFVECKKMTLELGFPASSLSKFGAEDFWLIHSLLLLKYGTIMNMWPKVRLEILFVDNVVGLRFLLFEGSLKQAVEFVLLVMAVFNRPDKKGKPVDLPMPVTSIRFKLSCLEDSRKRHVFSVYSFLGVKCSKWLYLDSKLQQHCLLAKQLPLSECTYDNIKALKSGSDQLPPSSRSRASSANVGLWKESLHGLIAKGHLVDSSFGAVDLSPKINVKRGKLLPFALSFSAAPSLFVSLHLKLLMDNNVASISLRGDGSRYPHGHSEKSCQLVAHSGNLIHKYTSNILETSFVGNSGIPSGEVGFSKWTSAMPTLGLEMASKGSDYGLLLRNNQNGKFDVAYTSVRSEDDEKAGDAILQPLETERLIPELKEAVMSSQFSVSKGNDHGLSVEVPDLQPDELAPFGSPATAARFSDMALSMGDNIVRSPKANGARVMSHNDRNSISSSHGRPGGKPEFIQKGFSSGPKKPRTQVQYTLPSVAVDSSSKHNSRSHGGLPFHRIRKANDRRAAEVSNSLQRSKGFLACDANVLITVGEKGWRECGARVELESADHNEWKLSVKLSGTTKFSYKAYQFMQPGSTNRYTHAMMWRGEKDWALEFPDRTQWMFFKEMHEECFNRNLRAASVKNIPIPGVRLIEECESNGTELPFVRSSSDYFRQIETDAEMAMDPSHILYDMDSEDEMWVSGHRKSSPVHGSQCYEISEELFERTMDMLEKVAFAHQREDFQLDEIEEFLVEIGPMISIRSIHEHWKRKRLQKGMPLIRHLQPPLWESYQQQVKEWEQAVARTNNALSSGCHDRAPPLEKPPMFAFCLKPRGLEMPNKGTKHRSHRRYPVSGHGYTPVGDHDGLYASGRRSNGYAYGDEKAMHLGNSHEFSDTSPSLKPSTRVFSPRDAGGFGKVSLSNDSVEWNHYPRFYRNKSKNEGGFRSPNNVKRSGLNNQRAVGNRNGVNRLNTGLSQWPNQRHNLSDISLRYGLEQLDGSDLDEFRLRDASGAAQHALNMARLKREKAQRLLYRADLATHKAVVALMTAEAIKASFQDLNDDNESDDDESTEEDDYSDDDSDDEDSNDSESTR